MKYTGWPSRNATPTSDSLLEAADAAAVPGARIDDHPRPAILARRHRAFGRVNAHQRVVDRPLKLAAVDDEVVVEGQHRREGLFLARDHRLAALAKRVEKKIQRWAQSFAYSENASAAFGTRN